MNDDFRTEAQVAYDEGTWCGECRYGVLENPPCCAQPTPGSRVANPPTPAAGAQNANGSHVTTVHDPAGSLAAAFHCLTPIGPDYCLLGLGHRGEHLPLPHPRPRAEDTPANPASKRKAS